MGPNSQLPRRTLADPLLFHDSALSPLAGMNSSRCDPANILFTTWKRRMPWRFRFAQCSSSAGVHYCGPYQACRYPFVAPHKHMILLSSPCGPTERKCSICKTLWNKSGTHTLKTCASVGDDRKSRRARKSLSSREKASKPSRYLSERERRERERGKESYTP